MHKQNTDLNWVIVVNGVNDLIKGGPFLSFLYSTFNSSLLKR